MNNQAFELLKAFIRVIGITFFLNAIFELTHLPEEVVYLSQGGFVARTAVAATTTLFFICILNLVMAVIFWWCSASVAGLVGKSLSPGSSGSGASAPGA